MARYLMIALLVALVCAMQTIAAPAEESTPMPYQDILKNAQDYISKNFNSEALGKSFSENFESSKASINKAVEDAGPKLGEILAQVQASLDNIMPKSEEPKKPSA